VATEPLSNVRGRYFPHALSESLPALSFSSASTAAVRKQRPTSALEPFDCICNADTAQLAGVVPRGAAGYPVYGCMVPDVRPTSGHRGGF